MFRDGKCLQAFGRHRAKWKSVSSLHNTISCVSLTWTLLFLAVIQCWYLFTHFFKVCMLSPWACEVVPLFINIFFLSLHKNMTVSAQLFYTVNSMYIPYDRFVFHLFLFSCSVLIETPRLQMSCSDWQPASFPCPFCKCLICWLFQLSQHMAAPIYHNSGLCLEQRLIKIMLCA